MRIKIPWNDGSLVMVEVLGYLGIPVDFDSDDGQGQLIVRMDEEDDARMLALWDELTDLRVRYLDAKQEMVATQLSYLEAEGDAAT